MDRVEYVDSDVLCFLTLLLNLGVCSSSSLSWQSVAVELDLSIDPAGLSSFGIVTIISILPYSTLSVVDVQYMFHD